MYSERFPGISHNDIFINMINVCAKFDQNTLNDLNFFIVPINYMNTEIGTVIYRVIVVQLTCIQWEANKFETWKLKSHAQSISEQEYM